MLLLTVIKITFLKSEASASVKSETFSFKSLRSCLRLCFLRCNDLVWLLLKAVLAFSTIYKTERNVC